MSKVRLNNNVYNNSVPTSQKDPRMAITKTSQLRSEKISVHCENRTKLINTLRRHDAEFLNVGGTQSYHYALKG